MVERIVALGAQRAKLAKPECIVVTAMWFDVISDRRRRHATGLEADAAQWLDHELVRSAALPAGGAIPTVDLRTVRHRRSADGQDVVAASFADQHHVAAAVGADIIGLPRPAPR
jgi:hypothetical protein